MDMLAKAGYPCMGVEGVHEAKAVLSKHTFDLFLLDVVMPDIDGLAFLTELMVFDNPYEVIMVTGNESLDDAAKAMELGAFGYLRKPVRHEKLLALVQKALAMVKAKKSKFDYLRDLERDIKSRTIELENSVRILETQAQRLDAIINSIGDGILAIDNENAVVLLNGQAEKILSVRFGDCAGQQLDRIQGPCSSPVLLAAINSKEVLEKNQGISISYDIVGKGVRQYNVHINEMLDKNGIVTGKLVFFSDQTEKILAEHLRNSFLTILAHELRTPVTIIMNYLSLFTSKACLLQQEEVIDDMRNASLRMKKLIDTIMSITVLSDPAASFEKSDVDICMLVEKEVRGIDAEMNETGSNIKIVNLLTDPNLRINSMLAKIIIGALLSNSVKFNRKNGDVIVRIEPGKINGLQAVTITFKDQGAGITKASQKHLFEIFAQGQDHLTRSVNGLGSGLFLAKRASKLLSGSLEMHENPEGGMSFIVTLPVCAGGAG